MSLCDSQIVRILALPHDRIPLVTGSDLVAALLADQNTANPSFGRKKILVVGPAKSKETILRERCPLADIGVMPAPNGLAQSSDLRDALAERCAAEAWDILLLCVGAPTQELVAAAIAAKGRASGIALCVGAAIDFVAGERSRAPRILQRFACEWAYRLATEPRRLWRRYLVEAPKIFAIYLATRRKLRKGRMGGRAAGR
jgi:exopolysaccharide biosynthesis WecB/TagA/CpsF family protein